MIFFTVRLMRNCDRLATAKIPIYIVNLGKVGFIFLRHCRNAPQSAYCCFWHRSYSSENILVERKTHTPPTLWIIGKTVSDWLSPYRVRLCHSAPPSMRYPSEGRRHKRRLENETQKVIQNDQKQAGDLGKTLISLIISNSQTGYSFLLVLQKLLLLSGMY